MNVAGDGRRDDLVPVPVERDSSCFIPHDFATHQVVDVLFQNYAVVVEKPDFRGAFSKFGNKVEL